MDSPLVSGAQYFDGFVFFELSGGDLLQQLERVINLPIGVLAVIAAAILVPPVPAVRGSRFDALGFASIAGAFLGLLLIVEEGASWGWTSYPILIVACVSIDLLVVFVVVQNQVEHPLLKMALFRNANFNLSLILISVFCIGMFVEFFYIPQFLQSVRGYTPTQAGLALIPQAIALLVLMPLAGVLYDRVGARWLVVTAGPVRYRVSPALRPDD